MKILAHSEVYRNNHQLGIRRYYDQVLPRLALRGATVSLEWYVMAGLKKFIWRYRGKLNNFYPVIKCHLPSTFHFRNSWDIALRAMNLKRKETVAYGAAYQKTGGISAEAPCSIETISKASYFLTEAIRAVRTKLIRQLR